MLIYVTHYINPRLRDADAGNYLDIARRTACWI